MTILDRASYAAKQWTDQLAGSALIGQDLYLTISHPQREEGEIYMSTTNSERKVRFYISLTCWESKVKFYLTLCYFHWPRPLSDHNPPAEKGRWDLLSIFLKPEEGDIFYTTRLWSVSKGLLTFLGSLYKEVAKTTSGTLLYRLERQTTRNKNISSFEKRSVLYLECKILKKISGTFR